MYKKLFLIFLLGIQLISCKKENIYTANLSIQVESFESEDLDNPIDIQYSNASGTIVTETLIGNDIIWEKQLRVKEGFNLFLRTFGKKNDGFVTVQYNVKSVEGEVYSNSRLDIHTSITTGEEDFDIEFSETLP